MGIQPIFPGEKHPKPIATIRIEDESSISLKRVFSSLGEVALKVVDTLNTIVPPQPWADDQWSNRHYIPSQTKRTDDAENHGIQ